MYSHRNWVQQGLTHLPRTKRPPFWQTTFSIAFSGMKMIEFRFIIHWNIYLGVQLTISHYLNQRWPSSLTHICGTRGTWVNVLLHTFDSCHTKKQQNKSRSIPCNKNTSSSNVWALTFRYSGRSRVTYFFKSRLVYNTALCNITFSYGLM